MPSSSSTKFPSSVAADRILAITNHLHDSLNPADDLRSVKDKMGVDTSYKFQGWMGLDKDSDKGNMVWQEFTPKTWSEDDVDIKVTHCGICGSDLHTLRSGWAPTLYPCCPGHEIAGIAVRVGSNVKHLQVGDRCGVGAQSLSCLKPDCWECSSGMENHCMNLNVTTYNGKYADGSKSYGGYADYCRAPGHFVVKIPDAISLAEAAPMLCGGVTTWCPLVKNGAGPGKNIGIIGIGGLGHFGLLWAKALGCSKVVAISRSSGKAEDAKKMGADLFIATDEDKDWNKKNRCTLDLIISTVSSPNMPLQKYLQLLRTNGQFIQVGAPEDKIPAFNILALINRGVKIGGSSIGSPKEISDMLKFAAEKGIRPWIEERPMKDANKAIVDMEDGKARYRYVLKNEANVQELGL
ncbi:putative cinnamyl-alcohol dehydrogenase 1 [Coleophoma cylindrospora]|uniref:alcohol dehydrogenase (NADP(+)) n=1 Tax=Coleophoma cylindrospora TaxID=1849047 RepID=A0A3D8S7D0_9HELO|nr:putative cinnamyl-alcohol dehydrogenase 1 [Coleophoma cylindrospora]